MQKRLLTIFVVLMLLCAQCVGCASPEAAKLTHTEIIYDTIVTITLYGTQEQRILDGCFERCRQYDRLFSRTADGSDIARVNAGGGQPVEVDAQTARLVQQALDYGALSDGLFDITIGSVTQLWDFSSGEGRVPDAASLKQALQKVDFRRVQVDDHTIQIPDGWTLDLGGIAKGYIADQVAAYLREQGVAAAILDLGGNIYALGQHSNGQPFKIGVQKPFGTAEELSLVVDATDCAVVTSGTYQRAFEQDGVWYHHLLDPATGMPANPGLQSVTILSPSSTQADALSTLCFLLGLEKGMALVEQTEGVECVMVDDDGQLLYSSGMGATVAYTLP